MVQKYVWTQEKKKKYMREFNKKYLTNVKQKKFKCKIKNSIKYVDLRYKIYINKYIYLKKIKQRVS